MRLQEPATLELWQLVMESAYNRAEEEQEEGWLQDKIAFWRENIVEAAGRPEGHGNNLLLQQQALQEQYCADRVGAVALRPGDVLASDWVGWRDADLQDWAEQNPEDSPTVVLLEHDLFYS